MSPWVKLDDNFAEHPKLIKAGPRAGWLHVAALCYCSRQLTDGHIPETALRLLMAGGRVLADRLVEAGLWEPEGDGWHIHDYLDYQPSAAKVRAERQSAQERMQRHRSGGVRANNTVALPLLQRKCSENVREPRPDPSPSRAHDRSTTTAAAVSKRTEAGDHASDGPPPPEETPRSRLLEAVVARHPGAGAVFYQLYSDLEDEHGDDFMWACYRAAMESGKTDPSAKYLEAIARRCKAEGKQPGQREELRDAESEPDNRPTEIEGHPVIGWAAGLPIVDYDAAAKAS